MVFKPNIYVIVIAGVIALALLLLVNMIWFRPLFIRHFFYREMLQGLAHDPQMASKAKVPLLYGWYKDRWNDLSVDALEKTQQRMRDNLRTLNGYKEARLRARNKISKQHLQWYLELEESGIPFNYQTYLINPYNGLQNVLPAYLDTHHYIAKKSDIKAYNKRLESTGFYVEQLIERMELARSRGSILPRHLLEASIVQMEEFTSVDPEKNFLYQSLTRKIELQGKIMRTGKLLKSTRFALENSVYPAYRRLINYCRNLLSEAPIEAGVWAQPNGSDYYRFLLKKHTTQELDPDSIHRLGLQEVLRVKDEMVAAMKTIGISASRRDVLEKTNALAKQPENILGYSIQGRQQCEAGYDSLIRKAASRLDEWFFDKPRTGLEVKRVPEFKQKGSSGAYYEIAPIDGSTPASFYVRMDILDDFSIIDMPTLAYHEGIPGHHYQLALQLENKDIPLYRKRWYNNAYIEGWAVYAERLMFEQGMYENDPLGNLGRLRAELLRAARLVVDTGLHYKKWSRQNAIDFLEKNSGLSQEEIASEVDRYLSDPGQACSYHLGMLKFLELRDRAKKALGPDFDLREFHRVVLGEGMVPMFLLEQLVDDYIAEKSA